MRKRFIPLLALGLLAPAAAGAQETTEGPRLRVNAAEIKVGGRVQTQFNTTSAEGEPDTELFIRRARLEVEVVVNELVSGVIQPEFAGDEIELKDTYLKLSFSPGLQVLAGNAYKPFSLLEQTSSKRILPIERGAAIRGITAFDEYEIIHELEYSDRDVGVQVMGAPEGAPLGFAYAAGVFRGPLHQEVGEEDSYQFAARATVTLVERVTLGAGWSSRDFEDRALDGSPVLERGHAFEVDFEYGSFSPGLHVLGEVAWGDFSRSLDVDFWGGQVWIGYRTRPLSRNVQALEPILRVSHGDTEIADVGGTLLTPGVTVWFGGLNRFMLNYDVWLPEGERDAESSFKAMFQLGL